MSHWEHAVHCGSLEGLANKIGNDVGCSGAGFLSSMQHAVQQHDTNAFSNVIVNWITDVSCVHRTGQMHLKTFFSPKPNLKEQENLIWTAYTLFMGS